MEDGICVHEGCSRPKGRARGLCNAHYLRLIRGKRMDTPVRLAGATDEQRFWSKVDKTAGCWLWTAATVGGYGIFRIGGRNRVAHRVSFAWAHGPIADGLEIDHMCFNKECVNPDHLRAVTHQENGQNRSSANANSKSGVRGVYRAQGQWIARVCIGEITFEVGRFADLDKANEAVRKWRRENMRASLRDQELVK